MKKILFTFAIIVIVFLVIMNLDDLSKNSVIIPSSMTETVTQGVVDDETGEPKKIQVEILNEKPLKH